MTTRISPNFRQQILCPQQVSVSTTLTGMDAYKVWTHTVVGTITFTLPAAKKGAGPMYFCEQAANNVIVVQPQATDHIVGNGNGIAVTLNTVGAFLGLFCELDGTWSIVSASPGVAGAGTVSSVGLAEGSTTPIFNISGSPVTTSGTLNFTLKTQTANTVFAGPTSGAAAQPTFRALVAADVPSSILPGGFTGFANPTALVGLVAINGVATTAMRSDAAPALDVTISPTWTGNHFFQPVSGIGITIKPPAGSYALQIQATAANFAAISLQGNAAVFGTSDFALFQNVDSIAYIAQKANLALNLMTNAITRVSIAGDGNVTLNVPASGVVLTVNGIAGVDTIVVNSQATINRASLQFQQGGVTAGYIGIDGGQTLLAGSTNGDLVLRAQNKAISLTTSNTGAAFNVQIAPSGNVTINAPASGIALTATGVTNNYTAEFIGSSTSGQSYGVTILAGTTAADTAFNVKNQANTVFYAQIFGDGHGTLGPSATLGLNWSAAGNVTINAPTSGIALTVNQFAGSTGLAVTGDSTGAFTATFTSTSATESRAAISFVNNRTTSQTWAIGQNPDGGTDKSFSIRDVTRNAIPFNITNTGNITIAAPTSGAALAISAVSNSRYISFTSGSVIGSITDAGAGTLLQIGTVSNHDLDLFSNNSTRLVVGSSGNITINAPTSGAALSLPAGTTTVYPAKINSGTNLTTPVAGAVENDGTTPYFTPFATCRGVARTEFVQCISAAYTLTSQTAAQKLLNATSTGAITLPIGVYEFECQFALTSMSATSGTFGFAIGGTAIHADTWMAVASKGTSTASLAVNTTYNTAANTNLTVADTTTSGYTRIRGIIRVTVAGTIIPQVSLTIAAAAVVSVNSFFLIQPIGPSGFATVGQWT